MRHIKHQLYAILLFIGAGLLLYRTLAMIAGGAIDVLVPWVSALLMFELIIDSISLVVFLTWAITGKTEHIPTVIRTTTVVVTVHAIRVLIFVLGRTGPWIDFDVRPEARALHATRWTWNEVIIAGILSALSVVALVLFLRYWRRHKMDWLC